MTSPLVLAVNGFRCEIVPDMGACIAGLWLDGAALLRQDVRGLRAVVDLGCAAL